MNCEDCLLLLDEYVEGELDENSVVQVSAHLEDCAACAGEHKMLCLELQAYSQFLPDIEASPALWTNVQTSVEKVRRERFSLKNPSRCIARTFGKRAFSPALAAMSLTLLITLSVIVNVIKYKSAENAFNEKTVSQKTDVQLSPEKADDNAESEKLSDDREQSMGKPEGKITIAKAENHTKRNVPSPTLWKPKNQSINSKVVKAHHNPTNEELIEKAERQYQNAIAILSSDIKRRRARLTPDLISRLDQSLAEIDRTITKTKKAVRAQPNDAVAVQYMTTAYAKKVELLRMIAAN